MLADDHTMLRQSVRRALTANGLNVVGEAVDGEGAVKQAIELQPDVVLMDLSMPVLDGVAATRVLRDRAPGVKVVILTMHAGTDMLDRAVSAGAVGYLAKSCTMDELVGVIQQAASGRTD